MNACSRVRSAPEFRFSGLNFLIQPEKKQIIVFEGWANHVYSKQRILTTGDTLLLAGLCNAELNLSELFPE
jgi:hypothetical protein